MGFQHFASGVFMAAGFVVFASCSATDEPPSGGRIESPTKAHSPGSSQPSPLGPPSVHSSTQAIHPPSSDSGGKEDAWPNPPFAKPRDYAYPWPPHPSEWQRLKLSPQEEIAAGFCPPQVWSQNVPDIDCTKHNECGDGFCDRGHCNAIWICEFRAGLRCEVNEHCLHLLCIEGRCQSCMSDDECRKKYGTEDTNVVCGLPTRPPNHRMCGRLAPRIH